MENSKPRGGLRKLFFRDFCLKFFAVFAIALLVSTTIASAATYDLIYDENGNLVDDEKYIYEYNSFNQLSLIKKQSGELVSEFFYDESGQRIKKTDYQNHITTYYLDELVKGEDVLSGDVSDEVYYYANGELVAKKDSSGTYFYHANNLGSTDIVTDENGNVVERTSYLPFGSVISGGQSRYLFTGQESDKEVDLMYYIARYYSPLLMRFIQPDTVISNVYDPQSLNRYSYVGNNPVNRVDPSGHVWWVVALLVLDIVFTAWDTYNMCTDPNLENGIFLTLDIAGFGLIGDVGKIGKIADKTIDIGKSLDKTVDTARVADKAKAGVDAVKAADKAVGAARVVERASDTIKDAEKTVDVIKAEKNLEKVKNTGEFSRDLGNGRVRTYEKFRHSTDGPHPPSDTIGQRTVRESVNGVKTREYMENYNALGEVTMVHQYIPENLGRHVLDPKTGRTIGFYDAVLKRFIWLD
jgi:RHS repeat-associated protein